MDSLGDACRLRLRWAMSRPSRELPECCADTQPELSLSGDSAIAACYFCSSVFQSRNEDSALIMTF